MNRYDFSDDDVLIQALGAALADSEAVPDDAVQAAYAAAELGALNEALAELVFDSADERELVSMRSVDEEVRLLSFVNDHITVDVELHADGETLVGQITPPVDGELDVERLDGSVVHVDHDEFGRFRVKVPHGPVRMRVVGHLVTPWISR